MPFTRRQIDRILNVKGTPFIDPERLPHLGMRVTESYLRRQLYAWEDQAVTQQWQVFNRALGVIRGEALALAEQRRLDTLGNTWDTRRWLDSVQAMAYRELTRAMQMTAFDAFRASLGAWVAGYYGKAWQVNVNTIVPMRVPAPDLTQAHRAVLLPDVQEAVSVDPNQYQALGADWRAAYEAERDEMRVKVWRALQRAMLQGLSVMAALRLVREAVGLNSTLRAGFTQNFYRMQTLTRTAIMDGAQDGGEAFWHTQAQPDQPRNRLDDALGVLLLAQVRWVTANDERVCPICRGLDGRVSSLLDAGRNKPPAHPNCRCNEVPVIAERWLIDADRYPGQTFDEWLSGFGGGLLLDDFLRAGLQSTQV